MDTILKFAVPLIVAGIISVVGSILVTRENRIQLEFNGKEIYRVEAITNRSILELEVTKAKQQELRESVIGIQKDIDYIGAEQRRGNAVLDRIAERVGAKP